MSERPSNLDRPPRRSSLLARVMAPLALIATIVALILVISNSGGETQPEGRSHGGGSQSTKSDGAKKEKPPKTYVVEPGDSLGTIAEQFGLSVDRLIALNKNVDPNALATGQELTLRK